MASSMFCFALLQVCVLFHCHKLLKSDPFPESPPFQTSVSLCCPHTSGTASGQGKDASIVMTVAQAGGNTRQRYTLSKAFTYDSPVITEVKDAGGKPNGPATGGNTITAIGKNFGTVDESIATFIGGTKATQMIWTSDTSIGIVLAPGVQGDRAVALSMDGKYGSGLTAAYDYDRAAITAVERANGPSTGGKRFTVFGLNFGTSDYSAALKVGDKLCTETRWVSDSTIECVVSENVGHSKNLDLNLLDKHAYFTKAYSYDAPLVTSMKNGQGNGYGNGPPVGGEQTGRMTTITGFNFGASGMYQPKAYVHASKGGGECVLTQWQSHSSLLCATANGLGEGADVTVVVGEQTGTLEDGFSYDKPIIIIPPFMNSGFVPNAPCNTPTELLIFGRNFGAQDYQQAVATVGGTTCVATKWKSDSTMTCTTPQGMLGEHNLIVSVESLVGTFTAAFSFDRPSIAQMLPQNGPAGAGHAVTILGKNFGTYSSAQAQTVFIGESEAAPVTWTSDSAIVARAPAGRGIGQVVAVLQTANDGGGTHLGFYTYDDPVITSAQRANGPQEGGFSITITGSSFGGTQPNFEVFVGDTACSAQQWVDDSTLHCLVREGIGKVDLSVKLFPGQHRCFGTADGMCTATKAGAFMYDGPHPRALEGRMNGPSSGQETITVVGSHFGNTDPGSLLIAGVGQTNCSETTWVSPTSLTCKLNPGVGSSDVNVHLAGAQRGIKRAFSYNAPSLDAWPAIYEGPQAGGVLITVTGENFGDQAGLGGSGIYFDDTESQVVEWISSAKIVIASSPGVKQPGGNSVKIGAPNTPIEELKTVTPWTYDHPMIFGANRSEVLGLDGNKTFTVVGKNFGGFDSTPTIFLGEDYTKCKLTIWSSDSSLACTTPAMPAGKHHVSYLSGAKGTTKSVLVEELETFQSSNDSTINMSTSYAASAESLVEFFDAPSGVLAFTVVEITAELCDQGKKIDLGLGVTIDLKPGWCNAGGISSNTSMLLYVVSSDRAPFEADASNSTVIATAVVIGLSFSGVAPANPISVAQPLDMDRLAAAGEGRRRLLQYGGKRVRQAWLNKCTGKWIPLCETTASQDTVSSSVTSDVATDACFDPSLQSGTCAGPVIEAEMCGTGGQILIFGYDEDPCKEASESTVAWAPIIAVGQRIWIPPFSVLSISTHLFIKPSLLLKS